MEKNSKSPQGAVLVSQEGAVGHLTLNRPEVYNAFNRDMALALQEALDVFADDPSIRAIYLGATGKAFCSGQDLKEATGTGASLERLLGEQLHPVVERLRYIEKPVLCAVNGMAAGAGASLALACDITVAAASAQFSQAFVKIGLIPDSGSTWLLPRLVGMQRAAGLMMLGKTIAASEAEAMGMIYKCFPNDSFLEESALLAHQLAELPTRAIALTKKALNDSFGNSLEEQLEHEMELQRIATATRDFREGITAFLEKRKPGFEGQ